MMTGALAASTTPLLCRWAILNLAFGIRSPMHGCELALKTPVKVLQQFVFEQPGKSLSQGTSLQNDRKIDT